jgi:hypothetical protein
VAQPALILLRTISFLVVVRVRLLKVETMQEDKVIALRSSNLKYGSLKDNKSYTSHILGVTTGVTEVFWYAILLWKLESLHVTTLVFLQAEILEYADIKQLPRSQHNMNVHAD